MITIPSLNSLQNETLYKEYVDREIKKLNKIRVDYELTSYDDGNGLVISEDVGQEVYSFFLRQHIITKIYPSKLARDDWDRCWSYLKTKLKAKLRYLNKRNLK